MDYIHSIKDDPKKLMDIWHKKLETKSARNQEMMKSMVDEFYDINNEISSNSKPAGQSEVWDYFGITADSNVIPASLTLYTNSRVTNLKVTTN